MFYRLQLAGIEASRHSYYLGSSKAGLIDIKEWREE